jgi:hypothetical protein
VAAVVVASAVAADFQAAVLVGEEEVAGKNISLYLLLLKQLFYKANHKTTRLVFCCIH